MYRAFFNFSANPFPVSEKNASFFLSSQIKQLMKRLQFAVVTKGFSLITGCSGSGKTALFHYWKKTLDDNIFKCSYLALSTTSSLEFFKQLCYALGLIPKFRKIDMFEQIQSKIESDYKTKKITSIIAVDDAHLLNNDILIELSLIFNFSKSESYPALVILFAHPFFKDKLHIAAFESLKSRINLFFELSVLSMEDTFTYIKSALKSVTTVTENEHIFQDHIIKAVYESTGGNIRIINNLCHHVLISAFLNKHYTIQIEDVEAAAGELLLK